MYYRPLPFSEIASLPQGGLILESSRWDADNFRSFIFREPSKTVTFRAGDGTDAFFQRIRNELAGGCYVAGFLAYELGHLLQGTGVPVPDGTLLAWLGVYSSPGVFDHRVSTPFSGGPERHVDNGSQVENLSFGLSGREYSDALAKVRYHIREGNVYQINFTDRFSFDVAGSPLRLYDALRKSQRVKYGAYVDTGDQKILSLSPELFFRIDGRRVQARPMKGTVRRGRTLAEDDSYRSWLAGDPKSRAENLMIVDLLRNDLSVVTEAGSVDVPELFETEPYETVTQMISTVEGRLRDDVDVIDVIRAVFPCGSVTGAPKIRAMQLIHELEAGPRGLYTGAIGYMAPDGEAQFNVAIRTLVVSEKSGHMGSGSGIVWDSDGRAEYRECLLKGDFLEMKGEEFSLIETMRWEGGCPFLDRHFARLRNSAGFFNFQFAESEVRRTLFDCAGQLDRDTPYRLRLLLDRWGRVTVDNFPLEEGIAGIPGDLRLAAHRVHSGDCFLFHKTTRRRTYEEAFRQASAGGCREVVFLNERDEVTEGSRSNIFVRMGGRLYTPPVDSGLLPGIYRDYLLETHPGASERILTFSDLRKANQIFICNAVRGLEEVRLEPTFAGVRG